MEQRYIPDICAYHWLSIIPGQSRQIHQRNEYGANIDLDLFESKDLMFCAVFRLYLQYILSKNFRRSSLLTGCVVAYSARLLIESFGVQIPARAKILFQIYASLGSPNQLSYDK